MTDESKQATGEEFGRIEHPDGRTVVIEDDGDSDTHVFFSVKTEEGQDERSTRKIRNLREHYGDEWVTNLFSAAIGTEGGDESSAVRREPPAFVCAECNRSWPRGSNQNPGDGDDICPECHEDPGVSI